jgi:hypothetical protein
MNTRTPASHLSILSLERVCSSEREMDISH